MERRGWVEGAELRVRQFSDPETMCVLRMGKVGGRWAFLGQAAEALGTAAVLQMPGPVPALFFCNLM